MTVEEVAQALSERTWGQRTNVLPLIRSGARVAIRAGGIEAHGTVRFSYGTGEDAVSAVVLDGTEEQVEVPWSLMHPIKEEE